ncbi:hypothetical protein MRB53_025409 [Persea americana]|uniref:Uncharacterized protein n=1 Tax=Persea americana TaxID=3435 RepID=A0ACC2LFT7_PERAE|nr:hypothetical protein MRB53_025409 [Persea americana]
MKGSGPELKREIGSSGGGSRSEKKKTAVVGATHCLAASHRSSVPWAKRRLSEDRRRSGEPSLFCASLEKRLGSSGGPRLVDQTPLKLLKVKKGCPFSRHLRTVAACRRR